MKENRMINIIEGIGGIAFVPFSWSGVSAIYIAQVKDEKFGGVIIEEESGR